jgi:S1-C subfamily serine protease
MGWLAAGLCRAEEKVVQTFSGSDPKTTTAPFTVHDSWELRWGPQPDYMSVTVIAPDGSVVAGASGMQPGSLYLPKGGTYALVVHRYVEKSAPWEIDVVDGVPTEKAPAAGAAQGLSANYAPPGELVATNAAPAAPTVTVSSASTAAAPASSLSTLASTSANNGTLTERQAHAVVVIKGDVAEGTGFLVHGPDGPAVITNLHVLAANPNVKIFTTTGQQITTTGLKGASDRDLAMISIQDNHYSYLDLATDIAGTVQNGDEVITPGNSEGGEVVLDTKGSVMGVGPEKIEISNPIYHGNSGGPVFHTKSGKVIAVVTQALKVRADNEVDKASFANKNSAITGAMRYFGLRIDTVPKWEAYDWGVFIQQTTFINNFHDVSRCLDSFMNGARYEQAHVASTDEYGPPNAMYYLKNAKLVAAHDNFHHMSADADQSQRLDAGREIIMDLEGVASTDMQTMQNAGNFYAYEAIRAQQEIKYREALAKEVENAGDKISDMGH